MPEIAQGENWIICWGDRASGGTTPKEVLRAVHVAIGGISPRDGDISTDHGYLIVWRAGYFGMGRQVTQILEAVLERLENVSRRRTTIAVEAITLAISTLVSSYDLQEASQPAARQLQRAIRSLKS